MDIDERAGGMADIEARAGAGGAGGGEWRWPGWYVAATAALMVGISVAMDFGQDPAMLIVVYCCGVSLLQIPLAARMRVRLHRSRNTFRVNWPQGALLLTVAGVYVLARTALGTVGAPLPSTLAGLLMTGRLRGGPSGRAADDGAAAVARADEHCAASSTS